MTFAGLLLPKAGFLPNSITLIFASFFVRFNVLKPFSNASSTVSASKIPLSPESITVISLSTFFSLKVLLSAFASSFKIVFGVNLTLAGLFFPNPLDLPKSSTFIFTSDLAKPNDFNPSDKASSGVVPSKIFSGNLSALTFLLEGIIFSSVISSLGVSITFAGLPFPIPAFLPRSNILILT
ncbi:hypothetical protein VAFE106499_02140 [Vagococcus fessus]